MLILFNKKTVNIQHCKKYRHCKHQYTHIETIAYFLGFFWVFFLNFSIK